MLSNAYFLAKIRFDTAENEPAKNFAKNLPKIATFFFRAQAVEEALRKDQDCPVEKETPKREREGASGQEEAQPPPPGVETWSSSQC